MKYSILFILITGMLALQSCNKETVDLNKLEEEIELREGNLRDNKDCFELVYPLGIAMPDETVISADEEEVLFSQIKAWYELNPDSKERPSLSYPVQVTFEGDRSKIIDSEEQMMHLKRYCLDKSNKERKSCFKLIFPIEYDMPDGTTISVENEVELRIQLKEWYKSNPDSEDKPQLSYPFDIKISGGDVITIDDEEEMIAIKKRCSDKNDRDCFKMDYPLGFTMPDGSIISVDSEDNMNTSIKSWYQNNPDSDKKPSLNYPVDVIFADGKAWTVKNEDEMIKLKKKCSKSK